MDMLQQFFHVLLHIDTYLLSFIANYGTLTYIVLFCVIFCETGLIVLPFLPGDSLLFAAGSAAAADEKVLGIQLLFVLLSLAAILGNKVNYMVGRFIGPKVFQAKDSWLFNKQHLQEAHAFYEKHGGKALIFARFIPIIRTFAPFVAGIGAMSLRQFSFYNMLSGILWVGSLLSAGYFFGSLPFIKEHFTFVIYGIIAVSLLPVFIGLLRRKKPAST